MNPNSESPFDFSGVPSSDNSSSISTSNESSVSNTNSMVVDTQKTTEQSKKPISSNFGTSLGSVSSTSLKVTDSKTPIIVLFGPPASGKTMAIVRLSRFLRKNGYTIKADRNFMQTPEYEEVCEDFEGNLGTEMPLKGTPPHLFLLLKVYKGGHPVCQLLEAAGELFYSRDGNNSFYSQFYEITTNTPNRKVWIFIAEAEGFVKITSDKNKNKITIPEYIEKIRRQVFGLIKRWDRVILLYNKIDKKDELFVGGNLNRKEAIIQMNNEYPGLMQIFINNHLLSHFWRPYNCKFVPFSTGMYVEDKLSDSNEIKYIPSDDVYPRDLWKCLLDCFVGRR